MPAFDYTALDRDGRTRKGSLEGDTPRQIRQQLREQGLTPLEVEEVNRAGGEARQPRRRGRLSAGELALMTRQLATLARAGLALEEALHAVSRQSERARVASLLLAVRSRVLEGHGLADALREFPGAFPELYCATVAAGEQAGHLDVVLDRLADYTENRQYLRQKTLMALFYPLLLTSVALLVVIGLLTYVVPQVVQVFANTQQQLPLLTRLLIGLSDFLRDWGAWLGALLVGVIWLFRYFLRFEPFRFGWHRLLLRLPLIGRLTRGINVARFTRTLSILSASGVPLLDSLRITAQVLDNLPMQAALMETADRVREGSSLHAALERGGLFPPMTLYLIASGEAGGNLEGMLERAARNQERELETLTGMLLALFEPLLILAMGALVLLIVLAILMPIFELNQLIK